MTPEVERLEAQAALAWPAEKRVLAELGVGGTVLEVGCGPGAVLERLREVADTLVAVEPDDEFAALARARVPEAEILRGRADALPLADGSVDFAVLRYVFQHVDDPGAAAHELRRVIRPGGLLVAIEVDAQLWGIAEPTFPEVAAIQAKVWRAQRTRGGDRSIGRRLPSVFRQAGFTDVAIGVYDYSSTELGLDAFDVHLDPAQLEQHVADGTITPAEYGVVVGAYRRFRADPDAFVVLTGLVVSGRV